MSRPSKIIFCAETTWNLESSDYRFLTSSSSLYGDYPYATHTSVIVNAYMKTGLSRQESEKLILIRLRKENSFMNYDVILTNVLSRYIRYDGFVLREPILAFDLVSGYKSPYFNGDITNQMIEDEFHLAFYIYNLQVEEYGDVDFLSMGRMDSVESFMRYKCLIDESSLFHRILSDEGVGSERLEFSERSPQK